jgi:hypothetical protein
MSPGSGFASLLRLLPNQLVGFPDPRCTGLPQPATNNHPAATSKTIQRPAPFIIANSAQLKLSGGCLQPRGASIARVQARTLRGSVLGVTGFRQRDPLGGGHRFLRRRA